LVHSYAKKIEPFNNKIIVDFYSVIKDKTLKTNTNTKSKSGVKQKLILLYCD